MKNFGQGCPQRGEQSGHSLDHFTAQFPLKRGNHRLLFGYTRKRFHRTIMILHRRQESLRPSEMLTRRPVLQRMGPQAFRRSLYCSGRPLACFHRLGGRTVRRRN